MNSDQLIKKTVRLLGAEKTIKAAYYSYEDFVHRNTVNKNEALRDVYKDHRCFILGTGVSLNEIDLRLLTNEYTFGCNYLFSHRNFLDLNINFYTAIGPVRDFNYHNHSDTPYRYYSEINKNCINKDTSFFFPCANKSYLDKTDIFRGRKVHYINFINPDRDGGGLSNDLSKRVTLYGGVLSFMISAAIYMGFKEIYLCGCGYTYQPILEYFFYDEYDDFCAHTYYQKPIFPKDISKKERDRRIKDIESRNGIRLYDIKQNDSYDVAYFVKDSDVHPDNEIMNAFANTNDVKICNIKPDGFTSPVYDGVSWQYVVKNILKA